VAPGEGLTRKSLEERFHGWCRPQVRQECAVENLAAFGLAAVKFLDMSWLSLARALGCSSALSALEQLRKNFPPVWPLL